MAQSSNQDDRTNPFERTPHTREPDTVQVLRPGERVGKLTIIGHIASGGMADIYKARHEELEVIRAIKILKPGHSQEDKGRFQTEAKISAHLHHPNIVQIYTVDLWQQTLPYIEMEYIEGVSLADLIVKYRRLPIDFAVAVCSIVCNALDHAQRQTFSVYGKTYTGLVHRDLKPANILLSKSGAVKLADFGIALPGNVSIHTVGPNTMGTYSYLSPEQLDGKPLDQRSDIYSLGTVLYESITGFKAFPSHSLPDLIRNKLSGTYRPVQSLVPFVPKPLVRIIEKSLSLDRDKRHETVGEFGDALRKALADIAGKDASAVITAFMQQPTQVLPVTAKPRFFLFNVEWIAPILAGIAVIAIISAVLLSRLATGYEKKASRAPHEPTKSVAQETAAPAPSAYPAAGGTVHLPAVSDHRPITPLAAPSQPAPAAKQTPLNLHKNNAGLTSRPIPPAAVEKKTAVVAPDDLVMTLESYIREKKYPLALEFIGMHEIDDGYFHLLKGKACYMTGDYESAEAALNKAQTTPTKYGGDGKQEATYLWALNRAAIYKKKPNIDNKKAALQGLRTFLQVFCAGGAVDARCDEVRAMAAEIE